MTGILFCNVETMNFLLNNIRIALDAIRQNLVRSILTILGIVIGVGSVTLLVGIGQGVKEDITRQIDSLGVNVAFILPGKMDSHGEPGPMNSLGISTLTQRDVNSLRKLPCVRLCAPVSFVFGMVGYDYATYSTFVIATNPDLFTIIKKPLSEGVYFNSNDDNQPVCVLANEPKQNIFGSGSALGKSVQIKNKLFKVVGTLTKEEPSLFGAGGFANMVYIPLNVSMRVFKGTQINRIIIETDPRIDPDISLEQVKRTLLANHHNQDDFTVWTQKQLMTAIFKVFNIVTALLAGISLISLIVAGIGIMNIMLVTVTERTKEIGIRKTVGAKNSDIFLQFLTEASLLSLLGGAIGVGLAEIICRIISMRTVLHPVITVGIVAMAFGVCFLTGIVFGVGPAIRASRQEPIQALRWE